MPTFTDQTPTIARKFVDMSFNVPAPYAEGHALTALEAKWMNGAVLSAVGNAYAGAIRRAVSALTVNRIEAAITSPEKQKKAVEAFTKRGTVPEGVTAAKASDLNWDHQARFLAAYAEYELGKSNRGSGTGSSTSVNPVESLTRFLAEQAVKAILVSKGLKVGTFIKARSADGSTSKLNELVAQYIERHPELEEQAKAQVEANAVSADEDEDIFAGLDGSEEEATPAAA